MTSIQLTRSHAPGNHAVAVTKTRNQTLSAEIVAKITPILEEIPPATCRGCGKLNHFEAVCRSKGKRKRRNTHHSTVNKVSENESADDDEVKNFKVHDTPISIMVDSGKIRVCVDIRQANQAIKRERHVTPTVKEINGDLAREFSAS